MADPGQWKPFYERPIFQGAAAVVGLLAAVWAFAGAPSPWKIGHEIFGSTTTITYSNTEIILDASAKTRAPFEGESKLAASEQAVAEYVAPLENDGIALRRAGGECGESELAVNFNADDREEVTQAAAEQQPQGKADIASAVRAAISQFQEARFKEPNTIERIVIFMSGEDECTPYAGSEIRDELAQSEINTVFRVVALRPSPKQRRNLTLFRRQLKSVASVEIRTPPTKKALKHVAQQEGVAAARADSAVKKAHEESSPGFGQGGTGESSSGGESSNGVGSNGNSNESSSGGGHPKNQDNNQEKRRRGRGRLHELGCPGSDSTGEGTTGPDQATTGSTGPDQAEAGGTTGGAESKCSEEEEEEKKKTEGSKGTTGATGATGESGAKEGATGPTAAEESSKQPASSSGSTTTTAAP